MEFSKLLLKLLLLYLDFFTNICKPFKSYAFICFFFLNFLLARIRLHLRVICFPFIFIRRKSKFKYLRKFHQMNRRQKSILGKCFKIKKNHRKQFYFRFVHHKIIYKLLAYWLKSDTRGKRRLFCLNTLLKPFI